MSPMKIVVVLFAVVVYCEANSLSSIEIEVRQLEDELKTIENQADVKSVVSFDNFASSKKELQDAIKAKKDSKAMNAIRINKLENEKRELEKLAFEKILLEDEPIVENTPISKEKKEIYDLMSTMMEDSTSEQFDEANDDQLHCVDLYNECTHAYSKCFGSRKKFMKESCNNTCEYCKVPSPKPCSASRYGCCWDRQTTKTDIKGTNCPICMNHYRRLCPEFKADCRDNNISGHFMRKFCAITCRICGVPKKSCFDSPGLEDKCQLWKGIGWCRTKPSIMRDNCNLTCQTCPK